jgi:lipopolysaccharide export system protein LptC
MIARSNRLFPIILVLLMALMTLWLDQISRLGSFGRDLNPSKPEYVSETVTATRFDQQGRILQRLTADKLWQFPNKNDLYFENGDVHVYQQGALDYSIQGRSGYYNTRSRQAYFDSVAHLFKPATGTQPEIDILTSKLSVDTVKRYASAPSPTTMRYGKSVANSVGFNYDYNSGVVNLLSSARVTYVQ